VTDDHLELHLVVLWKGFEVILHLAVMEYYVYGVVFTSMCCVKNGSTTVAFNL